MFRGWRRKEDFVPSPLAERTLDFGDLRYVAEPYAVLCRLLVDRLISPEEFERLYLRVHSSENCLFGDELFAILERLFYAVEDYCFDASLREEGDLDGDQLRDRARQAREELTSYFAHNDV